MSSKQPTYPDLTRSNYEAFFLLYVDGELPPGQMDAVEAFVALHPDLAEELHLLLETRIGPEEELTLGDTSFLMAPQMQLLDREEDLLLHLDRELSDAQTEALEAELSRNPALAAHYRSLAATRLDPGEHIACPFKEELLRREEKRRPLAAWWRVAAAVLLLLGGTAVWRQQADKVDNSGLASGSSPASLQGSEPAPATVASEARVRQKALNSMVADRLAENQDAEKNAAPGTVALARPAKKKATEGRNLSTAMPPLPQPDPRDRVQPEVQVIAAAPKTHTERTTSVATVHDGAGLQQNINSHTVTAPPAVTYTSINTAAVPEAITAVHTEEKRGSVRGFLRKATRFVERRTGIRTTNEDDQLLVAAVAIDLK